MINKQRLNKAKTSFFT